MKPHTSKTVLITLTSFGIYLFLKNYFAPFKEFLDALTHNGLISYILTYLILGIPLYLGTYLINPKLNILSSLGLSWNLFKPFLLALMFAAPMLLGGFIFFEFKETISIPNMIAGTLVIGFIEELFYRGFLFGQHFRFSKLGFIYSILIGAVLFGMGHLYQSQDFIESVGIFAVTFMGAVLFAWLYVEWQYNLWVPIFLHAFMNLAWYLFDMDTTALGGVLPNILRGCTIALAIVFTVVYKLKKTKRLDVRRGSLLIKEEGDVN